MKQIELTKETLAAWRGMTDRNEHIEVRIEIAKFFGLKSFLGFSFEDAWEEYLFVCETAQGEAYHASCILCESMLSEIHRQYGDVVYAQVSACL